MYTLFTSKNNSKLSFEAQEETLPGIINELGKWLGIQVMYIDPNVAADNKASAQQVVPQSKRQWYIFEGKDTVDGKLIATATLSIKSSIKY